MSMARIGASLNEVQFQLIQLILALNSYRVEIPPEIKKFVDKSIPVIGYYAGETEGKKLSVSIQANCGRPEKLSNTALLLSSGHLRVIDTERLSEAPRNYVVRNLGLMDLVSVSFSPKRDNVVMTFYGHLVRLGLSEEALVG